LGQEIDSAGFSDADFAAFSARLGQETAALQAAFAQGRLSQQGPRLGIEVEAWLIDRNCYPAPHNQSFLERLGDPMVVSELSRFNIELNADPQLPGGEGLLAMEREVEARWRRCINVAHDEVDTVVAIGSLPTLRDADLSLSNMTPSNRYVALNRELLRMRDGMPIRIAIDSAVREGEFLASTHGDVMLEAATTSLQVHLQVPAGQVSRHFNASILASAPLVAIAANSPFLFGHPLWHETRIPVFEQALEQRGDQPHRVTFGSGYIPADPTAFFAENLARYPVILPAHGDDPVDRFAALRLHNGTVWRWNRPLVGFDADGTPHLRIEHRTMAAGPSVIDMLANAAFYAGLATMLADKFRHGEPPLPFDVARANFYAAARKGLGAEIAWIDGAMHPVRDVLRGLAPVAREGLARLGAAEDVADRYMDVIELRLASGQNGAQWQLLHHARHGDLFRMTAEYMEHQRSGMPVHEWTL
jgi:gamma-glutamyl:cysteine ligase YbdK (ATP-grasp superfamily)